MLNRLSISNYAIINELNVDFYRGLNSVTGETGAGKSIILGALGLILGNRADLSVLKNTKVKCIIEGNFEIGNYNLHWFFDQHNLDYDSLTILRREITPSGKSRAFINDTPVNLKTIRELGLKLIDIHSQHQNLQLSNQQFQLNLVDTVAKTSAILLDYQILYSEYLVLQKEMRELKEKSEKANADLDYFQFQFLQLDDANLQENEQDLLETELEKLTHAEEIKGALQQANELIDNENYSVIQNVKDSHKEIEKIENFLEEAPELAKRLKSTLFELKDIADEIELLTNTVEHNPTRIEQVNDRLNLIYGLQQKHNVSTVKELIEARNLFDSKINAVIGYEKEIIAVENELQQKITDLEKKATQLTKKRLNSFSKIQKSVITDLEQLGMNKIRFEILHKSLGEFGSNGCDSVSILFSANSDIAPDEISKIASGGEMSRLMLAIKNLLRSSKSMPTVIFDEIDSGVSGEIAVKMGTIIKSFSSSTQIINITHLPQIAAKGDAHFQVYKFEENGQTYTSIKKLDDDKRVEELAKMVGGENLTASTLQTARELLNN